MPSPFPGMDPYLEQHWGDIHTRLTVYAVDALPAQLPFGLVARVEEGITIDVGVDLRLVKPDLRVVEEQAPPWSDGGGTVAVAEPLAIAEPLVVNVETPVTERHVEIRDASDDMRVVTVIEFLSPTNKQPGEHRDAYRRKQREYLAGGVNLVEVDLLRSGAFTLAVPLQKIPDSLRTPYMACVRRLNQPPEAEVYRAALSDRLDLPTSSRGAD